MRSGDGLHHIPSGPSQAGRAMRCARGIENVLRHEALSYRLGWHGSIVGTVLTPVFYLMAMGLGLGSLIDKGVGTIDGLRYTAFIAPGLLVANAMQSASILATYPILGKIRWSGTYEWMLATPTSIGEIVVGELVWMALRMSISATIFTGVMWLFGVITSYRMIAAIPVAVMTGMAFAAPITALSALTPNDAPFTLLQRFVILPMFFFGGVFFPLDRSPAVIQWISWCLPLPSGVELVRGLAGEGVTPAHAIKNLAVLAVYIGGGALGAHWSFRRALRT